MRDSNLIKALTPRYYSTQDNFFKGGNYKSNENKPKKIFFNL